MISRVITCFLYGFLFTASMSWLLPAPLPRQKTWILFLSTALYLYLTGLSGSASLWVLLAYGLCFAVLESKEKLLSLACSTAGFLILFTLVKSCQFITRSISLPETLAFLPHLGLFLVAVPVLYLCGTRLRALFSYNKTSLPGDFCGWILAWLFWAVLLLAYPRLAGNPLAFAMLSALGLWLLYQMAKLKFIEQKGNEDSRTLATMARYTENLEKANLELRRAKHDYANILSTMSDFIEKGNILGLKSYFDEQILPMDSQLMLTSFDASALSAMQIPEVKSLLINKILSEKAKGLKIKIQIASPISWMVMDTGDFCRILGIYLDNALDGAAESKKKELEISLDDTREGHSLVIINSCDAASLPMDRLEQTGFSTKGEGHGMGLATVAEILKKHPYVCRRTLLRDGYFIQQLDNF